MPEPDARETCSGKSGNESSEAKAEAAMYQKTPICMSSRSSHEQQSIKLLKVTVCDCVLLGSTAFLRRSLPAINSHSVSLLSVSGFLHSGQTTPLPQQGPSREPPHDGCPRFVRESRDKTNILAEDIMFLLEFQPPMLTPLARPVQHLAFHPPFHCNPVSGITGTVFAPPLATSL